jgi:hypothetical protein
MPLLCVHVGPQESVSDMGEQMHVISCVAMFVYSEKKQRIPYAYVHSLRNRRGIYHGQSKAYYECLLSPIANLALVKPRMKAFEYYQLAGIKKKGRGRNLASDQLELQDDAGKHLRTLIVITHDVRDTVRAGVG